jgi:aerobic C4-dicarboxylate transport protein
VEGLAILLGIDRFMSEARAITNLIGNGVATMVIARWEGALDLSRARSILAEDSDLAAEQPEALADALDGFSPQANEPIDANGTVGPEPVKS